MELKKEEWNFDHIKRIGEALILKSENDSAFKEKLEAAECTIDNVYQYIRDEAQKKAVSGCTCLDSFTVFEMAYKFINDDIWKQVKEKQKQSQLEEKARAEKKAERDKLRTEARKGAGITAKETKVETPTPSKPKKQTLEDEFGGLF